jgi:hypothetical protein
MVTEMTVDDVAKMLRVMKKAKMVTGKTKVKLSSDEEGNSFAPMIMIDGMYNVSAPEKGGADELIIFPA